MAEEKNWNILTEAVRQSLLKADYIVNKSYLSELENSEIVPLSWELAERNVSESACFFPIKKIVYDQEENNVQKLVNIYACASAAQANVAMIIRSSVEEGIEIYLGACDENENRINGAYPKAEILYNSFMGNFPGSKSPGENAILDKMSTESLISQCVPPDFKTLASVSGIASQRGQQGNDKNVNFYQGIEKVIETMNGKDYTLIILAKALDETEICGIRRELENLYTQLSAMAKITLSYNQSNSDAVNWSLAESVSSSINETSSESLSVGTGHTSSRGTSTFGSVNAGIGIGPDHLFSVGTARGTASNRGENDTKNENKTSTTSVTKSNNVTTTESNGISVTVTNGESIQFNSEDKEISDLLASIDLQLKRLKSGEGLGMFATAAYILAPTVLDAKMGASAYKAGISGDNTYVERGCVNVFQNDRARQAAAYLRQFKHPVFLLKDLKEQIATPASVVTAPELALHMGLPKKSVTGIPVYDGVSFGRNIISLSGTGSRRNALPIGHIYHLGMEQTSRAWLDLDSLTMHTFITGTTGSGKSNTVYGIIDGVTKLRKNVHFLVVEPAKGEYKTVFGNRSNVAVYGVNPYVTSLLRINPFRFRKGVHVLEHLDRLISIFNVCWPMEAAMPAVLKQGLERAYELAGWDLKRSENRYSDEMFPTFADVMNEVEDVMNESQYSDENRGNYIGALCTRLRELMTGLNGMVFTADDLSDQELFERNAVIDLSRIGSAETKSLIMGLVVVRLQEYRQTTQHSLKTGLSHITVLEEAHHLLKRTSTEQSMDGANLAGKSVEMLTNAFAEMRSAGEGFIIADQSPGLMDMSVIRNTNTKIIMRLPAHEDRDLTGKAIGLSELQIAELAKLPTGVAAVYQNDWQDAVLVKIPYYKAVEVMYEHKLREEDFTAAEVDEKRLLDAIMHRNGLTRFLDDLEGEKVDVISGMNLATRVKCKLMEYVQSDEANRQQKAEELAFEVFNMREAVNETPVDSVDSISEWADGLVDHLRPSVEEYSSWERTKLLLHLSSEYARRLKEFEPVYTGLVRELLY